MLGERGLSKLVRERINGVKKGVVLYDEEAPCDFNSQIMDGSFTYHMRSCRYSRPLAPIHPLRFAVPSFKTFEILVCDRPTGSWAEGVKWTFFNGEGIWLEGQAAKWFWPQTLAAIRKCHAILREHRDAFTSDDVTPLVPTEMGGVYANRFACKGKVAYTLYNTRHRTVSGEILAVDWVELVKRFGRQDAHGGRLRIHDVWNDREPEMSRRDGKLVISLSIGPRDVGCVVCTRWPDAHL